MYDGNQKELKRLSKQKEYQFYQVYADRLKYLLSIKDQICQLEFRPCVSKCRSLKSELDRKS